MMLFLLLLYSTHILLTVYGEIIYSGTGLGTYYFDITGLHNSHLVGETCPHDNFPEYVENNGIAQCESHNPKNYITMKQRNNNNIVAIDSSILSRNRAGLCGKAVNIWFEGQKIDRPFVVWDGCKACFGGVKIDFSLEALVDIDSDTCHLGMVPGIRWEVTDEQEIKFVP
jgi:hypothetical protein